MRKTLWVIPTILLMALGAPNAHADPVVQITVSNLTFDGLSICGPSGTSVCTASVSGQFLFDETIPGPTVVLSSSSTGNLGNFVQTGQGGGGSPLLFDLGFTNASGDTILAFTTGTFGPPGSGFLLSPAIGSYQQAGFAQLACISAACLADFGGALPVRAVSGVVTVSPVSVTVSPVPEPSTSTLTLTAFSLLLMITLKRNAKRLSQVS